MTISRLYLVDFQKNDITRAIFVNKHIFALFLHLTTVEIDGILFSKRLHCNLQYFSWGFCSKIQTYLYFHNWNELRRQNLNNQWQFLKNSSQWLIGYNLVHLVFNERWFLHAIIADGSSKPIWLLKCNKKWTQPKGAMVSKIVLFDWRSEILWCRAESGAANERWFWDS